jgi:hypothetical protein
VFGRKGGRIDKKANTHGGRNQFVQQAELSAMKKFTPVALPSGRLKLLTSPSFAGSSTTTKAIGIDVVAAVQPVPPACQPLQ